MMLHVADEEVLRDDTTRIAASAEAAGVNVVFRIWDRMPFPHSRNFCRKDAWRLNRWGSF